MNCLRCNTPNEEGARFCKNCGTDLSLMPAGAMAGNKDVLLLTSYIAWHFLTYIMYAVINRFVVPKLIGSGTSRDVAKFYGVVEWVVVGIDIAFLLVLA